MKTKATILTTLIAIAVIVGCKKEPDNPAAPSDPVPDQYAFQQFFADNIADATQSFSVNATTGGQVTGMKGTQLIFEPNTFLNADGTPVSGQVNVKLVEVLSVSDMIWLNVQTVGNDNGTLKMLRSGGAMNITASQSGNDLRITPGGLVVNIPTEVGDPAMELFSGNINTDGSMTWERIDSSTVVVEEDYFDLFYNFAPDSLQWMNCDQFYEYPDLTHVTATVPTNISFGSTFVWITFPSENAVVWMNPTTGQFFTTPLSYQGVPVGMQATIVALNRTIAGDFSSFTPITITNGMNVALTFTPTTLTEFYDQLNAL
ncbi:MAG: hypothetical protein IPI00_09105 [Flavobacteriales bacterium]|nr:hypothetical protein [Flavobacteriales bacterium]MBK6944119.1 hypothetical protein [Flavobacteriales bacterium]MBK7240322.1 hypothetical protein [Flavobacteriales bacterium]MBK9533787.1 hypothetical protein [Flavobacteriales bacterium]MBP9137074.1 hypothetical protein [Flavobacteriales bacterium]